MHSLATAWTQMTADKKPAKVRFSLLFHTDIVISNILQFNNFLVTS